MGVCRSQGREGVNCKQNFQAQKGFTLIEALLVLTIFMLIITTLSTGFFSLNESMEEKHFIKMLERDLLFGHTYAITNNQIVMFLYRFEENAYLLSVNQRVLIKRRLPEHISFLPGQEMNYFYFLPTGNINKFGTLTFYIRNHAYQAIFSIGKGRFRIVQAS